MRSEILGLKSHQHFRTSHIRYRSGIFFNMKEIAGIDHVGIQVMNLAHSRAFYEQLGFSFLVEPVDPEPNLNSILNANSGITENVLMDAPESEIAIVANVIRSRCR
ncbi:MAG: hypothetical protein AAFY57_13100 [Cyanobacteria bacterium J06642_2]